MKFYLLIIPVALLVAYSQIIMKLHAPSEISGENGRVISRVLLSLLDPWILSAYFSALFASFAWLFVVTKLPLTTAFPVYIGVTFLMVIAGGWVFLSEAVTMPKLIAAALIFIGVAIGVRA